MRYEGDEIQRGRFEAHVTPSNFLGMAGQFDEGIPTVGPVPDVHNDDPADVEYAYEPVRTGYGEHFTSTGLSGNDLRNLRAYEADEAWLKDRYNELLADGWDPAAAREQAIAERF